MPCLEHARAPAADWERHTARGSKPSSSGRGKEADEQIGCDWDEVRAVKLPEKDGSRCACHRGTGGVDN